MPMDRQLKGNGCVLIKELNDVKQDTKALLRDDQHQGKLIFLMNQLLRGIPFLETRRQFRNMKLSDTSKMDQLSTSPPNGVNLSRRGSMRPPGTEGSATGGSVLHRIPDVKIPVMEIKDEYDVEKTIAEGCFAKILLCRHRPTNQTVVLKAVHVELTTFREFMKEYHYNYQLSHHPNILSAYQVAFQATDYFVFAQEYAPYGDLAANLRPGGINEDQVKIIAGQLSSALGFMHSKQLVHRDLKLENVLVFAPDFSRIKLCDFGATTREGILVNRIKHTWKSFLPPEVLEAVKNERFVCRSSSDSWQFGIIIFTLLTGSPPWQRADWVNDTNYAAFMKYQKRKTQKIPDNFKKFTPRFLRAFRKYFDHDEDFRAKVTEVNKYMKDKWIDGKMSTSKSATTLALGQNEVSDLDSICAYIVHRDSRHSVDDSKTRLRRLMSNYGLEAAMDQGDAKKRIWEWVLNCEQKHGDGEDVAEGF